MGGAGGGDGLSAVSAPANSVSVRVPGHHRSHCPHLPGLTD